MVICTYFLNNNCRFGSRCNNEHIDICALVKNEVDVTLKGNQWPLSCFGPFKDRCSIPNFVEDRSFEEIRLMYLEAKMQNNLPAHEMQLGQMINDAKGKLQWLATMNRDILSTLVELYNQQEPSTKPAGASANPFVSIGSFGANATATSSIFGGSAGGSSFGSGFGGSPTVATASTGNIFGAPISGQAVPSTGNIFGVTSTAPKSNIFGAAAQPQQSQIGSGGNIFGMPQPSQHSSNGVFGGPAVGSGLGMFGGVQQPAQIASSIFGSVPPPNAAANGGNIFGHSSAQVAPAFGQQPSNAFGIGTGGNLFSSNSSSAGFGSLSKPQQTGSVFNSVSFGAPTATSPFVQPQSQSMAGAPTVSSQNLFLPAPTAASTTFNSSIGSNAFGSPIPVQPAALAPQSATIYSKMEDIPAEIVTAFNADQFQLGRIPSVPPPKELCH
ncbi:nuclear pore complex protein Nup98-Nup96-like [Anopheles bellator]|uniref:nuclear pore complex protein Nup98-Nup96-like n=1 Tax=Anopheles bellator TaxID=139047 RepID=UPI002648345F|nr:nuclear pore complex protein Nup98-Nup96-like [Anopheles bellator]